MNDNVEKPESGDGSSSDNHNPPEIVYSWWEQLKDRQKAVFRARRAELRRAKTVEEICLTQGFHDLLHRLKETKWRQTDRIAVMAAVLARVEWHDGSARTAAQMARSKSDGSSPRVSELRFRRLLRHVRDNDQLLAQMPRVLSLLRDGAGARVNVKDLASSLYWWNEKTRKQWALDYYDKLI
jgi:CRISPR system Cascade subunit CasB